MSSIFNPAGLRVRCRYFQAAFLVFVVLQLMATFSSASGLISGPPQTEQDFWYVLKIGGNTVGYSHDRLRILPARATAGQGPVLQTV